MALYGFVAWFVIGIAGGVYQWATPSARYPSLFFATLHETSELARHVAWVGIFEILLAVARWQDATARRWLLAVAIVLTVAHELARIVSFGLFVQRHLHIMAIIEGADIRLPSKAPVELAKLVTGSVGAASLIITVVALLLCRRKLRAIVS